MDAKTKKTWISVAVAAVIIVAILGVALLGTAVFVFRRHVNAQFVSAQTAQDEFQEARRRFSGQQPLIELTADRHPIIHQRENAGEIQSLRILAFDPRAGKLVRMSLPFWLLRMAPSRNLAVHSPDFDFDDRMHLTVDDVERAGPGLILDARDPRNGALVLVWTE